MTLADKSPEQFVDRLAKEGFNTEGGLIKLNQYMSKSLNNKGSGTSINLLGQLRGMRGSSGRFRGIALSELCLDYDLLYKGQGYPSDFNTVFNFMCDSIDQVRALTITTYKVVEETPQNFVEVPDGKVALKDIFKEGTSFKEGMRVLINTHRCFGVDCIGFVSQYLIWAGHIGKYPNWYSRDFITKGGFTEIKDLTDFKPLGVIVFGNYHIAICSQLSEVFINDAQTEISANIIVCESYGSGGTSGPMTRRAVLRQSYGTVLGPIKQTGVIDAAADVSLGVHPDLTATYPSYLPNDRAKEWDSVK